jgi:hypothetical protein
MSIAKDEEKVGNLIPIVAAPTLFATALHPFS